MWLVTWSFLSTKRCLLSCAKCQEKDVFLVFCCVGFLDFCVWNDRHDAWWLLTKNNKICNFLGSGQTHLLCPTLNVYYTISRIILSPYPKSYLKCVWHDQQNYPPTLPPSPTLNVYDTISRIIIPPYPKSYLKCVWHDQQNHPFTLPPRSAESSSHLTPIKI